MNARDFLLKYGPAKKSIEDCCRFWIQERTVDDFLSTPIVGGLLLSDYMINPDHWNRLPNELKEGFGTLMGAKADTYAEVKSLLLEKVTKGESSLNGLMNKIQGQMGELIFKDSVGHAASLAKSGSQEGYDVIVNHGDTLQFVQVKVYEDANQVLEKIRNVNEKIANNGIEAFEGAPVESIDFAVNEEIFEEVKRRALSEGLPNKILNIGASREEIRSIYKEGTVDIIDTNPLGGFFSSLVGGVLTAAAMTAAVNAYLVYSKAKSREEAMRDFGYGTMTSTSGLAAGLATRAGIVASTDMLLILELETVATLLGGPIGLAFAFGAGISGRALARRLADRQYLSDLLFIGNENLKRALLKAA